MKRLNDDPVFLRIDELMHQKDKKQKDLIAYLKIRSTSYTEWRTGISKTYYNHIANISSFLETTPNYLLTGSLNILTHEDPSITYLGLNHQETQLMMLYRSLERERQQLVYRIVEVIANIHILCNRSIV